MDLNAHVQKVDTPYSLQQETLGVGTCMKDLLNQFNPKHPPHNFRSEQISQELPKQSTCHFTHKIDKIVLC